MQLFAAKRSDIKILSLDLFSLLGLNGWTEEQKNSYSNEFIKTVAEYFLGVKVQTYLDSEQQQNLIKKFEELTQSQNPITESSLLFVLKDVSELVPDAEDLFIDALVETKIRVVKDQYTEIKRTLEEQLETEQDPTKQIQIKVKLQKCEDNLSYVITGDFEKINYDVKVG